MSDDKNTKMPEETKEPKVNEKSAAEETMVKETTGSKEKSVKTSKKIEDLIEEIGKLSVLELADLVKALEEKFGVSAAPVAVAAAPTATMGTAAGTEPAAGSESAPEQTTFNVILSSAGPNKISVIKAVREINQTLGLKDAKDLVEAAPKEILTGVNKSKAEEAKKKLEAVGATVELK